MSTRHHERGQGDPEPGRILIMTVGTEDVTKLEETLLTPLRKSVATGHWARVILLPSSTKECTQHLRQGLEDIEMAIRSLPEGDENDADRAYAHFDSGRRIRTAGRQLDDPVALG